MKTIYKSIFGLCLCSMSVLVTGCIDETQPTDEATETQISTSSSATKALLMAMPAYLNAIDQDLIDNSNWHAAFGYGAIMHIRDLQTGDMAMGTKYGGHFYRYYYDQYMGKDYMYNQYIWNYYYHFVMTTNNLISAVDTTKATNDQLGYYGAGCAYRAMLYLDLARMYEYLPTDGTKAVNSDGNNVTNYTVPIVKEGMSQTAARNNPRAKRSDMAAFILSDLDKAEKYISDLSLANKTLPHLDAVYGLKARLYMWIEDYANAQKYARLAINTTSTSVMTKDQCLNTTTGFNDIGLWMWGSQMTSEDDAVQTGIVNWISWMSNETSFGYAGAGPYVMIDAKTYGKIDDSDFRKLLWKAPSGAALDGQTPYIDNTVGASLPTYASVKFRPNKGNMDDYAVGAAVAFPLMRVEEMYFIEAEAAAHLDATGNAGKTLLEAFMKTYRDQTYSCSATTQAGIIDEIVLQKRIEFWGEGLSFFDYKRLNMSVTRGYTGTNHPASARLNSNGRPAWMNVVIVKTEENNNSALKGWDNPDPSGVYTPWVSSASAKSNLLY